MKTIFRASAVVAALWMTGCATSYESTWVDPSVTEPIPMAGKPVAVVVMSTNESQRRSVEQIMANEITKLGAKGMTGYSILPPEAMKDQARAKQVMQEKGVEAVVILRPAGERQEVRYVPGSTYAAGPYGSLWGPGYWGYSSGMMYDPGYVTTDRLVFVETLFYSVPKDKLLWGGVSQMTNPTKLNKVINDIALDMVEEMRKSGVLPK